MRRLFSRRLCQCSQDMEVCQVNCFHVYLQPLRHMSAQRIAIAVKTAVIEQARAYVVCSQSKDSRAY